MWLHAYGNTSNLSVCQVGSQTGNKTASLLCSTRVTRATQDNVLVSSTILFKPSFQYDCEGKWLLYETVLLRNYHKENIKELVDLFSSFSQFRAH